MLALWLSSIDFNSLSKLSAKAGDIFEFSLAFLIALMDSF